MQKNCTEVSGETRVRKTCLSEIYSLAQQNPKVFFIGSDLGSGTMEDFKKRLPDRFFMESISEGNVIGMAAGLALEGNIVYVNTISTFLTRRAYEQICIDICLHNLPVRLIGNGGGLVYAPLGPTHMATDDIALMRTLPNMTIIAPSDAQEMKFLMKETVSYPGPIYVRVAKGGDPIVSSQLNLKKIGKASIYGSGNDFVLITTGIMLDIALKAHSNLLEKGLTGKIIHFHTIKPFDEEKLIECIKKTKIVVSIEEHNRIGGLGSAVAEVMMGCQLKTLPKFKKFALPDAFPDDYGSQSFLLEKYGLTTDNIVSTVTIELLNEKRS